MNRFFKNFFAIIGMLMVLLVLSLIVISYSAFKNIGGADFTQLGKKSDYQIGVVELEGEISSSKDFREKLFKFIENKSIKGIVVRIDSPGGAVGASEEIYRYILQARKKKPVVCSLGNIAASGGLYSAMGCQKVITAAGTMSGSIGVIMMMPNITAVMDKVGVGFNIIKTGQFKDSGTPFREITDSDKEYLQGVAQTAYRQFITAISESRSLSEESVKAIADGRIILGEDAVKLGIADSIGGLYDAAKIVLDLAVGDLAKDKEPELIFPAEHLTFPELLKSLPKQIVSNLKTKLIDSTLSNNISMKYQ